MREIKFRLVYRGKIAGYEKWYPGAWMSEDERWVAKPQWLYSGDGEKWTPTFIPHNTKDEYTGLRDKGGTEIYEGDIVRASNFRRTVVAVEWISGGETGFAPFDTYEQSNEGDLADCEFEIIGNIHENPELVGT